MAKAGLLTVAVAAALATGCANPSGSASRSGFAGPSDAAALAALSVVGIAVLLPIAAVKAISTINKPPVPPWQPMPMPRPDPATLPDATLCQQSLQHGEWNNSNSSREAERRGLSVQRCLESLTDRYVCAIATAPLEPAGIAGWDHDDRAGAYIAEAMRRGHTPQRCRELRQA